MRNLLFLLILSILFFPTVAFSGQTSITSSGYYCSSDSFSSGNNNYTCSAGTIYPSGSGELCTYEQTPCTQTTSTPQCPSGYTWNWTTCTKSTTQTTNGSITFSGAIYQYGWNGSSNPMILEGSGNSIVATMPTWWNWHPIEGSISYSNGSFSGSWYIPAHSYEYNCRIETVCYGNGRNRNCYKERVCDTGTVPQTTCAYGSGNSIIATGNCYDNGGNGSGSISGSISFNGSNFSGGIDGNNASSPMWLLLAQGNSAIGTDYDGWDGFFGSITATDTCPSGYTYSNGTCTETVTQTTSPTCPSGTTLQGSECVSYSCPVGGSAQCIEPSGSSTYYCSPDTCLYLTYNNGTISASGSTTTSGSLPQAPPNNGTVTSAGCQGSIYIFSGSAVSCRSGGLQTAYHDCCNAGTYLFGAVQCNSTEKATAQSLTYDQQYGNPVYPNANYTGGLEGEDIYVGSYCSDLFLGMCLETMDVFCQFPGLLAATIQQQGRAQLGIGWGSAQSPDCSGFTPNQFQELNFGNMNLSNYTNVLEQTTINGLSGTVNNNISNIENSITNEINQSMSGQ